MSSNKECQINFFLPGGSSRGNIGKAVKRSHEEKGVGVRAQEVLWFGSLVFLYSFRIWKTYFGFSTVVHFLLLDCESVFFWWNFILNCDSWICLESKSEFDVNLSWELHSLALLYYFWSLIFVNYE